MSSNNSTELSYRAATLDDVDTLTGMLDATTRIHLNRRTTRPQTLERLGTPGCNLTTDSFLVSRAAEVVGFGHVWADPPSDVRAFARVRPDARGHGIGSLLARLILARAAEIAESVHESNVRFSTTAWARDSDAPAVLRAAGLHEMRHFLRMVRDLGPSMPGPEWPAGTVVRRFRPGADDRAVFSAYADAFAEHWGAEQPDPQRWWWNERDSPGSGFDRSLWTLAESDGEVVGFVLGRIREREGQREGYVSQIGVRPDWRGRRLATALLSHELDAFADRGLSKAALDVDADNLTSALRLYHGLGMTSEPNFTIWGREM
jgi:mycothiol synthase